MIDTTLVTLQNGKIVNVGYQFLRNGFGMIHGTMFMGVSTEGLTEAEQTEAYNLWQEEFKKYAEKARQA